MTDKNNLIRAIENGVWSDVLAMPVQTSRENLLDIVFKTDMGNVRITGKEINIDGEEWFTLKFFEFKEQGWWDLSNKENKWKFINYSELWESLDIKEMFAPPRSLYFYTNEVLSKSSENDVATLEKCTVIEIRKILADREFRLLITASQDNPFTVSLVWGEDKIKSILNDMKILGTQYLIVPAVSTRSRKPP